MVKDQQGYRPLQMRMEMQEPAFMVVLLVFDLEEVEAVRYHQRPAVDLLSVITITIIVGRESCRVKS